MRLLRVSKDRIAKTYNRLFKKPRNFDLIQPFMYCLCEGLTAFAAKFVAPLGLLNSIYCIVISKVAQKAMII